MLTIGLLELVSRSARAESSNISWSGPDCRDSQPLFEARLSTLVSARDMQQLRARVGTWQRNGKVSVLLALGVIDGAHGERNFEAPNCKAAAETAAVAAAMAAFSEQEGEPEPERSDPTQQPSTANLSAWALKPDPVPDFFRERVRRGSRPAPVQLRVGALGFVEQGALPSPSFGGVLELEVGFARRWAAAAEAGVSVEQARALGAGRRALLRLFSGALRVCYAPLSRSSSRIGVCSGAQLLWVRGHGEGFDTNRSASLVALAPFLGLALSITAPRSVEWRAELEAARPLSRRRFLVDGNELLRADSLSWAARLGPLVRF